MLTFLTIIYGLTNLASYLTLRTNSLMLFAKLQLAQILLMLMAALIFLTVLGKHFQTPACSKV